jgi:hypothetical protein
MIVSPQDDRVDRMREPAAVVAELREIETARDRLDRHANDPKPPRPGYTLDSLRVPMLEEQTRAGPVTIVGRVVEWFRARRRA